MNIFRRWLEALPLTFFLILTVVGVAGVFESIRQLIADRSVKLLAETARGPEEEKMVRRAAEWVESKGLSGPFHLQCKADGECALTYTRNGVLHGGMIRCYDKGCIALSGW